MLSDAEDRKELTRRFEMRIQPIERTLRRALVAQYGVTVGTEAAADAMAWAWEHIDRMESIANVAGYLYRVAQTSVRRQRRWERQSFQLSVGQQAELEELDAELLAAIARLKAPQRIAVVMVHGYGFSHQEVADVLGVTPSAVNNYVHRGLKRLRTTLGETQ